LRGFFVAPDQHSFDGGTCVTAWRLARDEATASTPIHKGSDKEFEA